MHNQRFVALAFTLLLIVGVAAACAPAAQTGTGSSTSADSTGSTDNSAAGATGEKVAISVSGAFALFPLMSLWAEEYQKINPNVQFDVQAGGAGKGMTDMLSGAADIAMLSREARQEEVDQGSFLVPVTIDSVLATANAENPYVDQLIAKGLTPESGAQVWTSGTPVTWGELLGTDATDRVNPYRAPMPAARLKCGPST